MTPLAEPAATQANRHASSANTALRSTRAWPHAALPILLVFSIALVLLLPIRAPWWYIVDSDGAYLGSATNLMLGKPTLMMDHPALSLQQLLSYSLFADYKLHAASSGVSLSGYADSLFLDLDRGVPVVRIWSVVFLLFGVAAAFGVVRGLSGKTWPALLAGLLYLAIPGHLAWSLHFRPGNVLSALCLLTVYLLIRCRQKRHAGYFIAAAFLWGLAIGVKAHAIALAPLFAWVHAGRPVDDFAASAANWANTVFRRHGFRLLVAAIALSFVAIASNIHRASAPVDWKLLAACCAWGLYLIAALWLRGQSSRWRPATLLVNPTFALLGAAVAAGMFAPTIAMLDELRPLAWQYAKILTGATSEGTPTIAGALNGLVVFAERLHKAGTEPLIIVCILAMLVEVRTRSWQARYWIIAAGGMFALAVLRGAMKPSIHYLAPGFALLIPVVCSAAEMTFAKLRAGLWRCRPIVLSAAGWSCIVAVLVGPICWTVASRADSVRRCRSLETLTSRYADRLGPNEVIMTNYGALDREASYFMLVREYCSYAPAPPQLDYPDTPSALKEMRQRGLTPAYYIAGGSGMPTFDRATDGQLIATAAWGSRWVVEPIETIEESQTRFTVYRVLASLNDPLDACLCTASNEPFDPAPQPRIPRETPPIGR